MDFLKYFLYRDSQSRNARLRGFKNPSIKLSSTKRGDASDSVGVPGLCPGHIRLKLQGPLDTGFLNTPITVKPDLSPTGALVALGHCVGIVELTGFFEMN